MMIAALFLFGIIILLTLSIIGIVRAIHLLVKPAELKVKRMQDNHQLLSDFLEELKVQYNGSNLNKYISIFYNDWSLNPYDEDDYSERVSIETKKLRDINSEKFKLYRVEWCDLSVCDPNFVEICVRKI